VGTERPLPVRRTSCYPSPATIDAPSREDEAAMKLLMFLANRFRFRAYEKMLSDVPDSDADEEVLHAAVVFVHTEPSDAENAGRIVTKAAKNIKWICGKAGFRSVVLHSFNHLGAEKAGPDPASRILARIETRLRRAGYEVVQTPFGYVCEWDLSVIGPSIGKVFKEI
jgi:hypothetical protein